MPPVVTMSNELPLVTGATGFAGGHLVNHLLESAPAVAAWGNPGGRKAPDNGRSGRVRWTAVDVTNIDQVARALGESRSQRSPHCAGIRRAQQLVRFCTSVAGERHGHARGARRPRTEWSRDSRRRDRLGACLPQIYRADDRGIADWPVEPVWRQQTRSRDDRVGGFRPRDRHQTVQSRWPASVRRLRHPPLRGRSRRAEAGLRELVLRVGNLDSWRDITDVRDTVRAYRLLMERGTAHRPYNVCRGEAYRIGDLMERLVGRRTCRFASRSIRRV